METRSERRRLISISSNVSSWPDLPAIFESLNDDTLTTTLQFVGNKSYGSFGGLNKRCKEIYLTSGMTKKTFLFGYAPLSAIINKIEEGGRFNQYLYERVGKGVVLFNRRDVLDWALQQRKRYVLKEICNVAAEEERFDILEEVWGEDDNRSIFQYVGTTVAHVGKLNVLKWLETKGLPIDNSGCANRAAWGGQLHILQWLQKEKGLKLSNGGLYDKAIRGGGHLHVMKWLREQGCVFYEFTFREAAYKGNLAILQWLHDEGCPWPDDYRVREDRVKPEVFDWLRANGYRNRTRNNLFF